MTERLRFDVWAPHAHRVRLVVAGSTLEMTRSADDWWSAGPSTPEGEVDYGYIVDDADGNSVGPIPDPRSRRQPEGVHGLTRTVDAESYVWNDDDWAGRQLAGGAIYELHIGTFTPEGTLDSAIERLDHLVSLGIDFVEVMPVNAFNGTHNWGYDGVLWFAVQETYGGPDAYRRFVDACHLRGLAVIQDVVYNHLGPSGNYLGVYGPYEHEAAGTTWGKAINLDGHGSTEVRRFILDNARMWFEEYHVDGLRLDAVHALHDESSRHLLSELGAETDAWSAFVGRPLSLIAESDLNDPVMFTARDQQGYGLAGQWSDDFHHAVHVALTRETSGYYADFEPLSALAKALTSGFFHDGTWSSFRGRHHGKRIDTANVLTWRLVVANQNHDQIGNRAIGDRLTASLDEGQLAIAAALTLLGPYTPMLFMGEEWGASTPFQFFTSHPEPELGKATAEGRIAEFERMGWDESVVPNPQDVSTFANSKLDWSEAADADSAHARLLGFYTALMTLRRTVPAFTDPRWPHLSVEFSEEARWLELTRGDVRVLINLAEEPLQAPSALLDDADVLLEWSPRGDSPTVAPHSVTVYRPRVS
ncbi:malto-oligosyltrehalose trehalohydrolase [Agreia sp. Leaf335]|uniref:malto-oligosyltrehalose trehalohydrolase n=1 Tax=Agreia sp. Leaf335 TaxID=1736340 RepID=UPI0006F732F4|nr:malto-oligosyltrehalose trehalohydrolase [Agreia sp. Leaf335]KQR24550.1 malto-oligosyltrehalose trehalohydrolase [Agreia sp. Leaf335]